MGEAAEDGPSLAHPRARWPEAQLRRVQGDRPPGCRAGLHRMCRALLLPRMVRRTWRCTPRSMTRPAAGCSPCCARYASVRDLCPLGATRHTRLLWRARRLRPSLSTLQRPSVREEPGALGWMLPEVWAAAGKSASAPAQAARRSASTPSGALVYTLAVPCDLREAAGGPMSGWLRWVPPLVGDGRSSWQGR